MNRGIAVRLALLAVGWGLLQSLLARAGGAVVDVAGPLLTIGSAGASVCALALAASRSGLTGVGRLVALAVLSAWVTYISSLVEAVVFGVIGRDLLVPALVMSAVTAVVLAIGVHATLPSPAPPEPASSGRALASRELLWRIPLCVLGFACIYLLAGSVAYPFVKAFYAGRELPPMPVILGVQLVRGLGLVLVTFPFISTSNDRGWARASRWGVVLLLLASVAPLLPRNPLMPGPIRLAHGIELACAHLLLGMLYATLLGPRAAPAEQRAEK